MEDFGELPERDQRQFEGHRTFRALEAHADTSLAGRQENGGVHAEAADFASYFTRMEAWVNGRTVSLGSVGMESRWAPEYFAPST
jgi:hypothetical protein